MPTFLVEYIMCEFILTRISVVCFWHLNEEPKELILMLWIKWFYYTILLQCLIFLLHNAVEHAYKCTRQKQVFSLDWKKWWKIRNKASDIARKVERRPLLIYGKIRDNSNSAMKISWTITIVMENVLARNSYVYRCRKFRTPKKIEKPLFIYGKWRQIRQIKWNAEE